MIETQMERMKVQEMSLYQALYAFEPERIAEMNLDQTVRVFWLGCCC